MGELRIAGPVLDRRDTAEAGEESQVASVGRPVDAEWTAADRLVSGTNAIDQVAVRW